MKSIVNLDLLTNKMEAGKSKEIINDDKLFYKYYLLSSVFPLIGLYFSLTSKRKSSIAAARIGGGLSCIIYGVLLVTASMYLAGISYLATTNQYKSPQLSGETDELSYYYLVGLFGWVAILLGAWVMYVSIGNYYRDNGMRVISFMELDSEPLFRCSLPLFGILISYFLYKYSRTKFLIGTIGSSCGSIALAVLLYLIGASSTRSLTICAPLFAIFSIIGGVGLFYFWYKLRITLLENQKIGEIQAASDAIAFEAGQINTNTITTQQTSHTIHSAFYNSTDDSSKLIDNDQQPAEGERYIPPAPSSHVAVEDYRANEDDEMNFQNGDLIGIEKDLGDGWAIGQNISKNRERGVFPLSLVTAIVTGPTQNVSRKKTSFLPRTISMKSRF